MRLAVDPQSAEPPYEQVRRQVTDHVAAGSLRPGDRLPTVRGLAGELGLAVNTVARAYRELESAGVIETRGRAGSFVTGDDVERSARQAATEYAARARALGLSREDAIALVTRVWSR
ncbi:GntR family transcriptional regulator [Nocardioides marmoribigeumensis]|uniref:GntR family transcriptional regulator n=1 Tax=Nocardioides marmoribigeumensis TaxID=433649 RepID=UPI00286CC73E|nr:GntR family transcriptional regulator [Nocardioides marmoribigeumensis]